MRLRLALIGALSVASGVQAQGGRTAVKHATGIFEVTMAPEAQAPAADGGVATSRLGLTKTYSGGLEAQAQGTMLAAGTPAPGQAASYVAIEQVSGTLDGHKGAFVLVHRGTMTKAGSGDLSVIVAPDSGTGALEGMSGTLAIRIEGGKHFYDLAYSLPDRR